MFVVPADDAARSCGLKYAVVRITYPKHKPHAEVALLRTDPPLKG